MRNTVHAEWTKARTLSATIWVLAGVLGATVAVSALAVTSARHGSDADPVKTSLTGVYLGQVVAAILGVLAISDEYGTGMIHVTLAAMPRRAAVLAAKAAVLAGQVLTAGTVAILVSALLGRLILPGYALTPALLRAAAGSVLYLTLIALLGLGIATAVRDAAVAIGIVLGLLFLFPIIAHYITITTVQHYLNEIAPMTAGLYIQSTTGLRTLPLTPWQGLTVLAAWTAAALLLGGLTLQVRDA
ncbi:MAG TPA: ABC transporter permease [Streptosporangiaceae bacterium]|nr:ABC transporter permease [Streptosporangiaceae bacterium]